MCVTAVTKHWVSSHESYVTSFVELSTIMPFVVTDYHRVHLAMVLQKLVD